MNFLIPNQALLPIEINGKNLIYKKTIILIIVFPPELEFRELGPNAQGWFGMWQK